MSALIVQSKSCSGVELQSKSRNEMDHPLRLIVHRRVIATYALNANAIDPNCFMPRTIANIPVPIVPFGSNPPNEYDTPTSSTKPSGAFVSGAGRRQRFDTATLLPLLYDDHSLANLPECILYFEFQCTLTDLYARLQKNEAFVAVDIALADLAPNLTRPELSTVAIVHGFRLFAKLNLEQAKAAVLQHVCINCPRILSVFKSARPVSMKSKYNSDAYLVKKKKKSLANPSEALLLKKKTVSADLAAHYRYRRKFATKTLKGTDFPPSPASEDTLHRILTNSSKAVQPDRFLEAGCAVCGRLTPLKELTELTSFQGNLTLLEVKGVTRRERFTNLDPIEELEGPVLSEGCDSICVECEITMAKNTIPRHALANHSWVGTVPPQLQDLKYAERMMIARIRHNRCVIRVNSGRVRMHANAIMFAQPILKVYLKLPPSREEMSDILAFVFTGSAAPTPADFARTPMLVRKKKVVEALEWLKLNHEGYVDLEISAENLASYKDNDIPVVVDYRHSDATPADSIPIEARSVNDNNDEHGTTSGECTFAVHGLTGAEYSTAPMSTIKAVALTHLTNKGSMLGIGRSDTPESMYNNIEAYPSMFPWLFPYGKGGFGHAAHKRKLSDRVHKRNLLLYHDKRFQKDMYFPMVAFNHEQLKGSAVGSSLMVKRSRFADVSTRLLSTDPEVAANIADRMSAGEHVIPSTDAEKQCFALLSDLDGIGARVKGSATSKKHQRNEIWSMSAFTGSPTWFITMAWVDTHHPIALYYAQDNTVYHPDLRKSDERFRLMSRNPVSAARFFHYMVEMFIKYVLCWESDEPGLFGHTKGYYGSVEQQGRLTLHLHLLLWIISALSPQQIKDRIMSEDSIFQQKLIAYLESCHQGEFTHGTMAEVRTRVETDPHPTPEEEDAQSGVNYKVPTQTLPSIPPPLCKEDHGDENCDKCEALSRWWVHYEHEVDDLILRSNVHTCKESVQDMYEADAKKDWRKTNKKTPRTKGYYERRGCLSKSGVCKARFPRDIFETTHVDKDGHINIKKKEANLNTVSKVITYLSRSNTDVTSLLSGTAVKAVISYVSDYVSKLGLKSYQAFASVYDVFNRNVEMLNSGPSGLETSRNLMRQMINSMSTKMEIGSPMASMYVLGNPDHYKSHTFVNFPWRTYVTFVKNSWKVRTGNADDQEDVDDMLLVRNNNGTFVASSCVDDYRYRPITYERVTLYEWIQCSEKKARTKKERVQFEDDETVRDTWMEKTKKAPVGKDDAYGSDSDDSDLDMDDFIVQDSESEDNSDKSDSGESDNDDSDWDSDDDDETVVKKENNKLKNYKLVRHPFLPEHTAIYKSHSVHCDFRKLSSNIPNFLGGAVPRSDKGDRDYYCMSMLTLFKHWRSPDDLKDSLSTWDQAFRDFEFTERQSQLIANFSLRYECNDARDDHYAIMRKKLAANGEFRGHPTLGLRDDFVNDVDNLEFGDEDLDASTDILLGYRTQKLLNHGKSIREILQNAKWLNNATDGPLLLDTTRLMPPYKSRRTWTEIVKNERRALIQGKLANIPEKENVPKGKLKTLNKVEILDHDHFNPKCYFTKEQNDTFMADVCKEFELNVEQERAFRIFTTHASAPQPAPLKMYLGGMGGSGKSRVFHAIIAWFVKRNEEYRFIVLGPTGSTAALLNGSTYHSVFRIPRDAKSKNQDDIDGLPNESASVAGINERLQGVEYAMLDEISMVSCNDLQALASQAAKARNIHDVEFGGLNVFLAGDFAQLPPMSGNSLYNGNVSLQSDTTMTLKMQNAVLGRILWHQFTTVVILRQNMRQKSQTPEDAKLRTALENMRYGACTSDDLKFLRTRIASDRPGHPHLDTMKYRNVSIITALNIHKDIVNQLGAERFARDSGQELVEFYSIDKLSSAAVDRKKWTGCQQARFKSMGPNLQEELWRATPAATNEHIPGCLKLCIGMPVMIKANQATELCITKGQEAIVVGWDASVGPHNKKVLDTLFVLLVKPPRPVQLPDLPLNVVPIGRTSVHITALLRDDSLLSLNREQVVVLPNFAMTDYASQGKSRNPNVVHLNNCKDHKAYYVALSRGNEAEHTVIIQGFDEKKITSGMSGFLRQEFRELEMLDEITRLRWENKLPISVAGVYRGRLITSYKKWTGNASVDPSHFHPSIRFKAGIDDKDSPTQYGEWKPTAKKEATAKSTSAPGKRKAQKDASDSPVKKQKKQNVTDNGPNTPAAATIKLNPAPLAIVQYTGPTGLIWDHINYSCSYDALFTPLASLWTENPQQWTDKLSHCSPWLGLWATTRSQTFETPEIARDHVKYFLNLQQPGDFPMGPRSVVLDRLLMAMTDRRPYGSGVTWCEQCGWQAHGVTETLGQYIDVSMPNALRDRYPAGILASEWFDYHFDKPVRCCPMCSQRMRRRTTIAEVPTILIMSISLPDLRLDEKLHFGQGDIAKTLRLRGLMYHSVTTQHFTSIVVDGQGLMWYHDGITTGRTCKLIGNIKDITDLRTLHLINNERLAAALYGEEEGEP